MVKYTDAQKKKQKESRKWQFNAYNTFCFLWNSMPTNTSTDKGSLFT